MKPIFIGIAGGSGAGKSTVCTALQDVYPEYIGLIQLDDYFRPEQDVPTLNGHTNWDHPDALYLDKLAADLAKLTRGMSVMINTKNERLNPAYKKTNKRIPVAFRPMPIMLVEGYLVLHDESVRSQLTTTIWLEVDHNTRWDRRVHFKYDVYEKEVLIPMHTMFAEPSKAYAEHSIDVTHLTKDAVLKQVVSIITEYM